MRMPMCAVRTAAPIHLNRSPEAPSRFRSDINGLRAWAVGAVMLYHFGVPGFGGGYVGVDLFFVISGFLMTGIVVGGLLRGDFSVWAFYMARARRIVPALVALCAVLLTLGWWLLLPLDYKHLAQHALAALGFFSNIQFWREAGYFDTVSHEKWLLHTWSLSVEWQFYLLLPLGLGAVWKYFPGRRSMTIVIALALLVSLALSMLVSPLKPTSAFFLLPTRAWEMLAGGLVYMLALKPTLSARQRRLVELAGFALIVAAIAGLDSTSVWPGWRALVPVLGAVLVLVAGRPDSRWTGTRLAQLLGSRSYSLYLWHWPIVVALAYTQRQTTPSAIVAGLILTLVLGELSFRWVEAPARQKLGRLQPRWGLGAMVSATLVVAGPGAVVHSREGVAGRFPESIELIQNESLDSNPRKVACHPATGVVPPGCQFGGKQLQAILLGDSHANALVSALALAAPGTAGGVIEWSYSACPILRGTHPVRASKNQCSAFVEWAIARLADIPPNIPVVVANRHGLYAFGKNEDASLSNKPTIYFSRMYRQSEPGFLKEYAQHLTDTACALAKTHPVYLLRPIPEMGTHVPNTARAIAWGEYKEVSISLAEYHRRNEVFWAAQDEARTRCGVKILDPLPYLCHDGRCPGLKDGRPLYYDDNHLSEFGNRELIPLFAQVFQAMPPQAAQ